MASALQGIRVVELTVAVAGPVAGATLADMGADVIKVEQPQGRSPSSSAVPPAVAGAPDLPYNRAPFFNELHRGKRHLAMDLATEDGHALFLRIAAEADVVIENFSPRVVGNLRVDYAALREVKPDIICISMPAFGKTGPYANRGSYGPGIDAMSGLSHLTGYMDRGPGKPANFYCDQNAGMTAALTALSALRHRNRTGEGQYIELSMLEGELQVLAPALMDAAVNGREQYRSGNRHAWMAPHGLYRCAGEDNWVALAVDSNEAWLSLCAVIGRGDLPADPQFATRADRYANQHLIDPLIEEWTLQRTHYEAQHRLQAAGVSAGAVLDVAEVHDDPQLKHRESLAFVDHPQMGPFPHTRTAWRSRRGNHGVAGPAPAYGDGIEHVLKSLLGLSDEEIEAVVASGVVARVPTG
ncbi:MAG TPA: CoA transferase [Dehalococcoidia bacterium]|nr:CoA transferase [Dehalococcoidia bacterium]